MSAPARPFRVSLALMLGLASLAACSAPHVDLPTQASAYIPNDDDPNDRSQGLPGSGTRSPRLGAGDVDPGSTSSPGPREPSAAERAAAQAAGVRLDGDAIVAQAFRELGLPAPAPRVPLRPEMPFVGNGGAIPGPRPPLAPDATTRYDDPRAFAQDMDTKSREAARTAQGLGKASSAAASSVIDYEAVARGRYNLDVDKRIAPGAPGELPSDLAAAGPSGASGPTSAGIAQMRRETSLWGSGPARDAATGLLNQGEQLAAAGNVSAAAKRVVVARGLGLNLWNSGVAVSTDRYDLALDIAGYVSRAGPRSYLGGGPTLDDLLDLAGRLLDIGFDASGLLGVLGPIPAVGDLITVVTGKKFKPSACPTGCFVRATPAEILQAAVTVGLTAAAAAFNPAAAAAVPGAVKTAAQIADAQKKIDAMAAAISGEENRRTLKEAWEAIKRAVKSGDGRERAKKLSDELRRILGGDGDKVKDLPPEAVDGKSRDAIRNRALATGLVPATVEGREAFLDPVTGLARVVYERLPDGSMGLALGDIYGRRVLRSGELMQPGGEARPDAWFPVAP